MAGTEAKSVHEQRWQLLGHISAITDKIMTALAFVWVGLMVWEFTHDLSQPLVILSNGIWVIFVVDFAVKVVIAPNKMRYLRANWLTAVALILPAFRMLRVARAARALRALKLARVVTSLNRGIGATARAMQRHGLGYVVVLTILIVFGGAAGMFTFEQAAVLRLQGYTQVVDSGGGFTSYSDALWWTTMMMTTMGPQYWPVTTEGRILCLLLALYAFAVFGYITATIASIFVRQDHAAPAGQTASNSSPATDNIDSLRAEIAALRKDIAKLNGVPMPNSAEEPRRGR